MLFRVFFLLTLFFSTPWTQALPLPDHAPILTVTGAIKITNQPGKAVFDAAMLARLEQKVVVTHNPWSTSARRYRGVTPQALLDAVGADGNVLRIKALNNYITEVPVSDFRRFDVVFATHVDGEIMSVRSKGPIMLVYNFDSSPTLQAEVYYGRSIWQITSIEVIQREP
ncbi:hypothetical protein FJM67_06535 [Maribrevibacterium harenarium]|uniref:Oxidoreductase molybdopterin-binding domain-containing protein n=1 Tax=Maribrevibacterium harenarium TaxID=2589817 RepID=A0A501WVL4_9GAMM|nr:hypothetical protein [Maribrevibacterium harenarium]TPE53458.1 hypothetical protein FJM67_06535 [Maribrevibacterium harenarium]